MNGLATAVDYVSRLIMRETVRSHEAFNRKPPATKQEMEAIEKNTSELRRIRDSLEALAPLLPHE